MSGFFSLLFFVFSFALFCNWSLSILQYIWGASCFKFRLQKAWLCFCVLLVTTTKENQRSLFSLHLEAAKKRHTFLKGKPSESSCNPFDPCRCLWLCSPHTQRKKRPWIHVSPTCQGRCCCCCFYSLSLSLLWLSPSCTLHNFQHLFLSHNTSLSLSLSL